MLTLHSCDWLEERIREQGLYSSHQRRYQGRVRRVATVSLQCQF